MSHDLPASLLDELDKKLLVLLRDGRTLIGYLRSIDQFSNLLLHQTIERIYVKDKYGDIPRGIFLIRGENVALCGEIDEIKEMNTPLKSVPIEDILELQQNEIDERKKGKFNAFQDADV
ncbi:PREDICTED: U6 snRNA-associated Sm-like protein LSm1 [Rhagoletis zephyria]|uniref:U6 snRNA-associated Sm-like protein LSm1 n=1 Tax=Rhagoletis zephyria TaxID=28612 RepID=UPI00081184A3|nr:PREDICTED: U6 snRNA-associated Sm-like protein LSm1 [Rhagoletis zephyria]KAH9398578.1 SM-like, degradation of cytoplasmic mRNAs and positively regulates transcription initiation [Tyrophagus putrescentiae]